MSPARSKRQAPMPHQRRPRRHRARRSPSRPGSCIVTALLVWLLRPGPAGVPATGGSMNRQPRSSWLVGVAIGVAGLATWWILVRSGRRTRAQREGRPPDHARRRARRDASSAASSGPAGCCATTCAPDPAAGDHRRPPPSPVRRPRPTGPRRPPRRGRGDHHRRRDPTTTATADHDRRDASSTTTTASP